MLIFEREKMERLEMVKKGGDATKKAFDEW